ncbi:MFS transporter [Microbacterium kyungheense]|uniref:Putative MFS family arabinose efflux permease n=1 Tax=Microbacterium kyungheense TaxID=1263636 RepID=A0A543F233_9MICO|nr:MFS transporter [Microbacterium kyungheense]TQM27904.1 putative MFS family arabinose efflux permease [Microbacterium kyungheense]
MSERAESPTARDVLWRFGPMVYGPTVLFALGEGAVIPLVPVIAAQLGADVATAALVASALVVGQLCGNLPAGWAVARIGERLTMAIAGVLSLGGILGMALAPSLGVFAIAVFLIGFCAAAFGLARHSFMTTRVPLSFRARALSLLGGTFRLGMFVGPFIAAGLLAVVGDEHATIWFFGGCLVATVLLVLFGPDPEKQLPVPAPAPRPADADLTEDTGEAVTGSIPLPTHGARGPATGVIRTMWRHRRVLSTLGLAAASLSAVRSARQVVLPLWGVSIGLDAQTIALVVGISGAIDFALFYASGQVMDRFGRLWAALPAMILMGAGFIALSLTHDVPQAAMWFAMFAAVLGVGNGLSSGILLTLGADVAPKSDPAAFLGSWRTLTDAGGAIAPLIVSGLAAIASLALATGVMGGIGLLGALAFIRWVPRYVPRSRT